jgi:hypothetical protein
MHPLGIIFASFTAAVSSLSTPASAAACLQADARTAKTAHIPPAIDIKGAGSIDDPGGGTRFIWTGTDCVAWIIARPSITIANDERSARVALDGRFIAHEEAPTGTREYSIDKSGIESLSIDGKPAELSAANREWVATMVREYLRRSGVNAGTRARATVAAAGSDGALREAAAIPRADIRVVYLIAGFSAVSDSAKRSTYTRDAVRLLNEEYARAHLLASIPVEWRNDRSVLTTVYQEASRIRADGAILVVVNALPPPRPLPPELRESVRDLIDSIRNSEQRAELRGRFLDSPR